MLLRHTILYLPSQLLPALAQFVSLIVWSHFASASVIGIVTLTVSIQEFLVLGFMGFWTSYTIRYANQPREAEAEAGLKRTSTIVVFASTLLQAALAIGLYLAVVDSHAPVALLPLVGVMVAGRAFNTYQAERGRSRGDILLYSAEVIIGPVAGMILGVPLLIAFGNHEILIFFGFAVAQLVAVLFGLLRDRQWIAFGRPDGAIVRHSLRYGMPLITSSALIWVTQNTPRLLVAHFFGLAAAGLYALGFGLGFRVAMIAAMSVTAAAFPIAVRYSNAGDHDGAMNQLAKNAVLLLAVMAPCIAGLAVVSHDIVSIFIAASMRGPVYPIMSWALLAGAAICFRQHFLHQVFLLEGNTRPIGIVSIFEAILAVAIGLFLVPQRGALGGIVSLAGTSLVSLSVMFFLAGRTRFRIPWREFAKVMLAAAAMVVAVWLLPPAANVVTLIGRISLGSLVYAAGMAILYRREAATLVQALRTARLKRARA